MNDEDTTSTPRSTHVSITNPCTEHATDSTHSCPKCSDKPTAVSLGCELEVLQLALQGAQILVDVVRHGDSPDQNIEHLAPHACSAMLSLVSSRMRLVRATIADHEEVGLLVERHNAVHTTVFGLQPDDVLLPIAREGAVKP